MSDTKDIVERLKTARDYYSFARPNDTVFRDAIAEIRALRSTNAELVEALRTRNGPDFLEWIADRLVHVYGESPNVDFVLSLRERADRARSALARNEVKL